MATLGVVEAEEPLTNLWGGDATTGVVLLGIKGGGVCGVIARGGEND